MVQQSMTSRTFTEVADSLKKMYSELPYKVNEADLSEDIEFVIENFKMNLMILVLSWTCLTSV